MSHITTIAIPGTPYTVRATRPPEGARGSLTHRLAIHAGSELVGRGWWDGASVVDCDADLGEDVWDVIDAALAVGLAGT